MFNIFSIFDRQKSSKNMRSMKDFLFSFWILGSLLFVPYFPGPWPTLLFIPELQCLPGDFQKLLVSVFCLASMPYLGKSVRGIYCIMEKAGLSSPCFFGLSGSGLYFCLVLFFNLAFIVVLCGMVDLIQATLM